MEIGLRRRTRVHRSPSDCSVFAARGADMITPANRSLPGRLLRAPEVVSTRGALWNSEVAYLGAREWHGCVRGKPRLDEVCAGW